MKREYKITKSNLGYNVYRVWEENWFIRMERLQNNSYTLNRDFAKTFYHLNDATSALVIAKSKWETLTTSIKKSGSEGKREKKSWYE